MIRNVIRLCVIRKNYSSIVYKMWTKLLESLYLLKLVFITVFRHYVPGYHQFVNFVKKLKGSNFPIVTITNGTLRGTTGRNFNGGLYYSFQGIPYAKPPVGNLRFKAPQPVESWTGIKDATHEGNDCVSRHPVLRVLYGSEDCLTLNVYTPKLPIDNNKGNCGLLPVMFFIHGGGFTTGSGSAEVYGPEFLLTEDVVLVTINYRTGIFGFLRLEDPDLGVPGNAGLKDTLMALKWVQRNIAHFSGDPKNVTVFGESAGAAAAHFLVLSQKAKGLLHKAILQSGSAINLWARSRTYTQELADILGLKIVDEYEILQILQKLSTKQLFKISQKFKDRLVVSIRRPHGPVIERNSDDAFIWEDPLNTLASGKYNHVPIMAGCTLTEGMMGDIVQRPNPFRNISDFEHSIPKFYKLEYGSEISKQVAQQIKEFYFGDEIPSVLNKDKYYLLEGDNFFLREILLAIKCHAQVQSDPVYFYRLSLDTKLNIMKKIFNIREPGVCHADDLGYLFKNVITSNIPPGSDEEIGMTRVIRLWTNFAKYGNPNPRKLDALIDVEWKPVDKDVHFLDIGKELIAGQNPDWERMRFWKDLSRYSRSKFGKSY